MLDKFFKKWLADGGTPRWSKPLMAPSSRLNCEDVPRHALRDKGKEILENVVGEIEFGHGGTGEKLRTGFILAQPPQRRNAIVPHSEL